MATLREIRKRISSVANTKKITRTMEMVATAKMKRMQDRLQMSQPYNEKIGEMLSRLSDSATVETANPLIQGREKVWRVLVILVAGNRGLCGGYNTNVIEEALKFKEQLEADGKKEVLLYSIGNKSKNFMKFINQPLYKSMDNFEDKLTFEMAAEFADEIMNLYLAEEVDEVYVSYTKVITSATQKPTVVKLLPIESEKEKADKDEVKTEKTDDVRYIFEPDPQKILEALLPLSIKLRLFMFQIESSFSEQFARRVAMKNATDAASDMIRELTIGYNRARQAKITGEIAEIVGGAAALE